MKKRGYWVKQHPKKESTARPKAKRCFPEGKEARYFKLWWCNDDRCYLRPICIIRL